MHFWNILGYVSNFKHTLSVIDDGNIALPVCLKIYTGKFTYIFFIIFNSNDVYIDENVSF